jgi:hypothetical protein
LGNFSRKSIVSGRANLRTFKPGYVPGWCGALGFRTAGS